jgi:hypothetical protein
VWTIGGMIPTGENQSTVATVSSTNLVWGGTRTSEVRGYLLTTCFYNMIVELYIMTEEVLYGYWMG